MPGEFISFMALIIFSRNLDISYLLGLGLNRFIGILPDQGIRNER
jgi:hypothetical protein